VCQKQNSYGVCGIEIKAKAIYGWRMSGTVYQSCQAKIRTVIVLDITICDPATGEVASTPQSIDSTTMLNRCCDTSIVTGCSGATEFDEVPAPTELTAPSSFSCSYGGTVPDSQGNIYIDAGSGAAYFHIERTLFIPGATELPDTPLTFTPSGQTTVGMHSSGIAGAPTIYSTQPSYGAGTQTVIYTTPCGRNKCSNNYMNGILNRNDGFCTCDPTGGDCISDRARSETHIRSIPAGDCFLDAKNDTWEITIRDPV
jgi:hypothetical protein